ncbi:hypothetical protein HPB48_018518 [Haemaphysalis longicornis]|uniref:Uncharacterized protein n=1 Tax=Haemaphysalis longicornis TaxID=44386 RepID=A0A9J6GS28_HAELO|nr:hypothetical protein HPB48_018518 [Haemaphysalis longicornis]
METHIDQDASALGCEVQNAQPWITVTNSANRRRQRSSKAVTPQQQLIVRPTKRTVRQNRPICTRCANLDFHLSLLMIRSSQYGGAADYNSARTTEFIWVSTLHRLKTLIPKKLQLARNKVHTWGGVSLPKDVECVLSLGPKFAAQPRKSVPEKVAMVRQVARLAHDSDVERCVSEGIDVLSQHGLSPSSLPLARTVLFLREQSLALLAADEKGGFAVFPTSLYRVKAQDAIDVSFEMKSIVCLSRVCETL